MDPARRAFLTGGRAAARALRPPWAATRLADACTGCGDCVAACGERVLSVDECGVPRFDPHRGSGACSFCGDCAAACPEALFEPIDRPPWRLSARIDRRCLAVQGVLCQSCADTCEVRAIRFIPRLGGITWPRLDRDACTGCGGCVAPCPAGAVTLFEKEAA